jgi:hypothetical protein
MHATIRHDESIDQGRTAERVTTPIDPGPPTRARTVGHVTRDAQLRVDRRVRQILARREVAVERARRAARRLSGG